MLTLTFTISRRVFLAYCYTSVRFASHVSMSHDTSKLMFSIDCGVRDCVSPSIFVDINATCSCLRSPPFDVFLYYWLLNHASNALLLAPIWL